MNYFLRVLQSIEELFNNDLHAVLNDTLYYIVYIYYKNT